MSLNVKPRISIKYKLKQSIKPETKLLVGSHTKITPILNKFKKAFFRLKAN